LLKNDIPWQPDPLRDFENMGDYFMDVWRKELNNINANYVGVGGQKNRLLNAINAVDSFLATSQ
jgi:nicotinamide riboside kinase